MEYVISLNDYFNNRLNNLNCLKETKAYIVGIFSEYKNSNNDLSNQSITEQYILAISNYNFEKFQKIGDYLFFANTMYPESLNGASKDYYYNIAQISFLRCYKIIRWPLFEEISDRFDELSDKSRQIILEF